MAIPPLPAIRCSLAPPRRMASELPLTMKAVSLSSATARGKLSMCINRLPGRLRISQDDSRFLAFHAQLRFSLAGPGAPAPGHPFVLVCDPATGLLVVSARWPGDIAEWGCPNH